MYSIVKKLGGEIYAGGNKAMIPGPGHSPTDRSISLLLSPNGKIRVHAFSDHDWREVMDWLKAEDLVSDDHRLIDRPQPGRTSTPMRSDTEKRAMARLIWEAGQPLSETLSKKWLTVTRRISRRVDSPAFRHAPNAPLSAYSPDSCQFRNGFLAKVTSRDGTHTGTEITYLDPTGRKDSLAPSRPGRSGRDPAPLRA